MILCMTLNKMKKKLLLIGLACIIIVSIFFIRSERKTATPSYTGLKIISLGPYVTENICLLGFNDKITGLTVHDSAEQREGKEIIGTLLSPNIEKILALKPDIVIASKEGNREESLRELEELNIKTLVLDELYNFEDICENLIELGEAIGAKEIAVDIVNNQKRRLKNIQTLAEEQKERKKVFFILGFKPLFTTGKVTYINEMIDLAGGENIFANIDKKWFSCSIEEVIKRNPQVILFLRMEEEEIILWETLQDVDAVKNQKYSGIEPTIVGSPTPESFVDSVENLYRLMYLKTANED